MLHPRIIEIMKRAVRAAQADDVVLLEGGGTVPVSDYTSPSRLAEERAKLFRAMPIPVAHRRELDRDSGGNNVLVREVDGVSILITRRTNDDGGAIAAFKNSCRHRGVRLARSDCQLKAFTCPYHGWTYGLDGALMHIPHAQAFPSCAREQHNLVPVHVEERHGLIWITLDSEKTKSAHGSLVAEHLGPQLDDELASFRFDRHVVGRRAVSEHRGNWKMLVEAFLDGYHIRQLHRNSVYPFFLDGRSVAEREGALHIRAASARRTAKEVRDIESIAGASGHAMRDLATLSYVIFPSTTLIMHPDWTSVITVQPLAPDRFAWSHTQLIEEDVAPKQDDEIERAHFDRSFSLIEGSVFQKEDLLMCAEMQAGIETGANAALTFGLLESPALWLHEAIASRL